MRRMTSSGLSPRANARLAKAQSRYDGQVAARTAVSRSMWGLPRQRHQVRSPQGSLRDGKLECFGARP